MSREATHWEVPTVAGRGVPIVAAPGMPTVAALDLLEPFSAPVRQGAGSTLASSLHEQLDILPRADSLAHLKSGRVDRAQKGSPSIRSSPPT